MLKLKNGITELYRKVATSLPPDIENSLKTALGIAMAGSEEESVIREMLNDVKSARLNTIPFCENIGTPVFVVQAPSGISHKELESVIKEATRDATKKVPLAPNAIDPVSGSNSGDNTGEGYPVVYFEEAKEGALSLELFLTPSRAEVEGRCYSLPDRRIDADRSLQGIAKCVLDAVRQAGGRGCPPYIIGVGIGATRDRACRLSRRQLLRKLTEPNPNTALSNLETSLLAQINGMGIGVLGRGGKVTALGVNIGANHCHVDSFIVDVSFSCWAIRRGKLIW